MPTPKLNRLAQQFMSKIQDPILLDGGSPEKFLPGGIIRTVDQIERYLHEGAMKYFQAMWSAAAPDPKTISSMLHKRNFLNIFPELFKFRNITVTYSGGYSYVDLTSGYNDVHDVLDSVKSGGGGVIEVWDQDKLTGAQSESDPFYSGDRIADNPGMILQQPNLFLFPNTIAQAGDYTFQLNYIQNVKNPTSGDILRTGGSYDIPFAENNFDAISDMCKKIYEIDDHKEDAGG